MTQALPLQKHSKGKADKLRWLALSAAQAGSQALAAAAAQAQRAEAEGKRAEAERRVAAEATERARVERVCHLSLLWHHYCLANLSSTMA